MKTRICYQDGVSKGQPLPLTKEKWDELIDSPEVKNICQRIAELDVDAADYNDRKQALKKRLPVILPHASSFAHGRRVSADATPSGLAMLDVDHVESPWDFLDRLRLTEERPLTLTEDRPAAPDRRETAGSTPLHVICGDPAALTEERVLTEDFLKANRIVLVAVTASGKGLRVIGERLQGESIEAAQVRMAQVLGIKEYDAVTKDLARASYVVPRSYILYVDEPGLLLMDEQDTEVMEGSHADNGGKYAAEGENAERGPLTEERSPAEYRREQNTAALMTQDSAALMTQNTAALTYRGIAYSAIVEQLMIATGNGGGAVQGERNTVYFSLANYMRYICDFDAEVLLQVLPDFGLSVQERRQAISSAIGRPRKSEMPLVLQSAIAVAEREASVSGDGLRVTGSASEMAMPALPRLLKLLCRRLPEEYRPAMVIASLPVLGALATRVRFEYLDRQEQSLSFFSCITAPAASGKSFIRKPLDLLLTPINEQDAIEREKEQAYKDKLRASKNSKNQPEDPHACPRNNGVSISIAKLLQLLTYAEGKHLIGIGEEMDTLVKSEKAGVWSQKSDIYRLAFDNAEYGQAYMSDASFNAHIKVYYNLLLTGTPNSMKRFFKDLENGLATRVAFAQLPDTSFTEIPVFAPYSESEKAEIIRWARQLDSLGNAVGSMEAGQVVRISCPQVGTVISDWLEKKRQQAIDADSHAMDTLRRRAAVIGFRAGMLCYLLENNKWTKVVSEFAEWVAEYVFRNQMELWGDGIEQLFNGDASLNGERGSATSLLALLPEEFSTGDLIKLRARKGQSVKHSAVFMVLNRWRNNKRIDKIGDGQWRKM